MKNRMEELVEILNRANVYLSPAYCVPELIRKNAKTKNFVVLHDAIPYLFPEISSIKWTLDGVFPSSYNNSDYFFCDSQQTLEDYKKLQLITDEKRVSVAYLAADKMFCPQKDSIKKKEVFIKYHIPSSKRYIFSLCSVEPRKNLIRAVRSFILFVEKHRIENLVWVMGGGQWNSFVKENKAAMRNCSKAAFACQSGSGAEKAFEKLKEALGVSSLEAELVLIDPKDRPDAANEQKIADFCAALR